MAESTIEWTDATWNPVTGCSKVSPGCAHCYAETLTRRFASTWGVPDLPWTPENAQANVILHPERLDQPLRWKRPRMIFVNSMSDLFHEEVPDHFVDRVFARMAVAGQHTFQVLTKRPERMRDYLLALTNSNERRESLAADVAWLCENGDEAWDSIMYGDWPLPNVWLGASIENRRYVERAALLRETPAAVRFISAEPLLGPLVERVTHGRHCFCTPCAAQDWSGPQLAPCGMHGPSCPPRYAPYRSLDLTDIDWLIVGGESGPHHRRVDSQWVRDLRDACLAQSPPYPSAVEVNMQPMLAKARADGQAAEAARTAFFFKQWGGARPKANGRELDGRTWDEMPGQPISCS